MMFMLALLALVLKVVVPPGFMLADTSGAGVALVICTGHGPLTLGHAGEHKAPPAKSRADAPCAFAGNITPTAPVAIGPAPSAALIAQAARIIPLDQAPGRGLVAPPPPAIGPPTHPLTA
jgi:hypothetical protein